MVPGVRGLASSNISHPSFQDMGNARPQREEAMLVLVEGPGQGNRWELNQDEITIGRHPSCYIVLPDRRVSRFHARITRQEQRYVLEDLGSKNGTFVNGEPVQDPWILKDGDEISIALAFKMIFVDVGSTAPLVLERKALPLRLDKATRKVWVRGEELSPPLSPSQFRLLQLLYDAGGRVVSRDEIAQYVWPDVLEEGVTEQAIDALVHRLRERLASVDPDTEYIVTVRGHGFRLGVSTES